MRVSVLTAAVATLLASSASAANCGRWKHNLANGYTVEAWGVTDRAGICGGLWDNLNRFLGCATPSLTDCSGDNGYLSWTFQASAGCNGGMVESTWWEATRNQWGSISCPS